MQAAVAVIVAAVVDAAARSCSERDHRLFGVSMKAIPRQEHVLNIPNDQDENMKECNPEITFSYNISIIHCIQANFGMITRAEGVVGF